MGPRLVLATVVCGLFACVLGCGEPELKQDPSSAPKKDGTKPGETAQGGPKLELNPDYKSGN